MRRGGRRSFRRRGGRRPFGRRRAFVVPIRRAKTRVVTCVFEQEAVKAAVLGPTNTTFNTYSTINFQLPGYVQNGSGNQAVMYALSFPLSFLVAGANNYGYIEQLYDYVKLNSVRVRLKCTVKPEQTIQTSALTSAASYNFNTFPQNDPVLSYMDYDGWQPMPIIGGSGYVASPANGDMTQYIQNKVGVRRHPAFGSIIRTFVPKTLIPICVDGTSGAAPSITTNVNSLQQFGRQGWLNNGGGTPWTGNMIIAIPYLAQPAAGSGAVNYQPMFGYTISNLWNVSFKAPLYG